MVDLAPWSSYRRKIEALTNEQNALSIPEYPHKSGGIPKDTSYDICQEQE